MTELLPEFSSSAYLTDTQLSRLKRIPNREKRSWALLTVSAMYNLSASRRRPRTRLASSAAVLWRGPEGAGGWPTP
jgi:hypothetical protein